MLAAAQICHRPIGPLQPNAPVHEVSVPVIEFISRGTVEGPSGYGLHVAYDVQQQMWRPRNGGDIIGRAAWRTDAGTWTTGDMSEWQAVRDTLPPPAAFRTVQFPLLPELPVNTQPLPRTIHHIWVGPSLPNQRLIDNMARNSRLATGHTITLHTDISDELFAVLEQKLKAASPELVLSNLRGSDFFQAFRQSSLYPHYTNAITGAGANYAGAADILRYRLLNHHGGIYMDIDDQFRHVLPDMTLNAAPNDVLLGPLTDFPEARFSGYNNSIFATHPNNPVIETIIEEMLGRLEKNTDFFLTPKPNPGDAAEFNTYLQTFFSLTGPQLFNDVLSAERPDYYTALFNVSKLTGVTANLFIFDPVYVDKVFAVAEHYFPFFKRAPVFIGEEQSWRG